MKGINIWKAVLLLPFLLVLFASPALSNKIDQCKTDKDVERFIRSQDEKFRSFSVEKVDTIYYDSLQKSIADSLGVKAWQKIDFDQNGQTDLLVYGMWRGINQLLAFIDEGEKFSYHLIGKDYFDEPFFPVVSTTDNQVLLIIYKTCAFCLDKEMRKISADTLCYKSGNFIEPNFNFSIYQIDKIIYSTTMCMGSCPVFELEINSDKTASYNAIQYNDKKGIFKTIIDTGSFTSIISLLNYISFPSLKNNYSISWTDNPSCTLTVYYNNGQVKKISDYGLRGTYGLRILYGKLFALRKNQDWK